MAQNTLPRYHLNPQSAEALLEPLVGSLSELESRLNHYVEPVSMPDADRAAVAAAVEIVASARAGVLKAQRKGDQEHQRDR